MHEQVFVTGATGCIGHYVLTHLRKEFPNAHLHLMVRNLKKFKCDISNWENITIHHESMATVDKLAHVFPTIDYLIHIATVWGYDLSDNIKLNRDKTLEMFNYLDPNRIKKIIYFSTASILSEGNHLCKDAEHIGTPYVKSKYAAYISIKNSKWVDKITTLFPTIVLGGGKNYPYSHISQGLIQINRYIKWLKWLKLDGNFHFLHADDIAKVTVACLTKNNLPKEIVLGNANITFNHAISELCKTLNYNQWLKIPVPNGLILGIIKLFRLNVDSWAKHCIKHPFFNYDVINPLYFGKHLSYQSLSQVLTDLNANHANNTN